MKDPTAAIVALEWKMFQQVNNIGGRAACQNNYKTFNVMRSSQIASWSDEVASSYLEDLKEAENSGRNLLSEKYARMMATTAPEDYAKISHLLPPLEQGASLLIDKIAEIHAEWSEEVQKKYPRLHGRGRPAVPARSSIGITSADTYLRGELATYSLSTLKLYLKHALLQKKQQVNGVLITLEAMVRSYGYRSLEEAEQAVKDIF